MNFHTVAKFATLVKTDMAIRYVGTKQEISELNPQEGCYHHETKSATVITSDEDVACFTIEGQPDAYRV